MNKKYKLKSIKSLLALLLAFILASTVKAQQIVAGSAYTVNSPDQNIRLNFYQKQLAEGKRAIFYTVTYKGKPVILESALDLQLDNHLSESAMALKVETHEKWCENLIITNVINTSHNTNPNSCKGFNRRS